MIFFRNIIRQRASNLQPNVTIEVAPTESKAQDLLNHEKLERTGSLSSLRPLFVQQRESSSSLTVQHAPNQKSKQHIFKFINKLIFSKKAKPDQEKDDENSVRQSTYDEGSTTNAQTGQQNLEESGHRTSFLSRYKRSLLHYSRKPSSQNE